MNERTLITGELRTAQMKFPSNAITSFSKEDYGDITATTVWTLKDDILMYVATVRNYGVIFLSCRGLVVVYDRYSANDFARKL
jgi:hypothetical protein